jgi:hypothetical protein
MAFMFRDFDDETAQHGDHLPSVGGSVDRRLPPEPRIVAVPCRLSSDFTLHNHTDSAAPLTQRDSQQVGASSAHDDETVEPPEAVCGACLGTGQHAHFMGLCSHCRGTGKVAPPPAPVPDADELCRIALSQTDFLGDLVPGDAVRIFDHAANAINWAAEIWSENHDDVTVPLEVVEAARKDLTQQAHDILADLATLEEDALFDAMEAGDLDHDGAAISYPRYYGV